MDDVKGRPAKREKKYNKTEAIAGVVFALPWIVGFLWLTAFPFFYSLYLAMTNASTSSISMELRGIANFRAIITDPEFWKSTLYTLQYVLFSVPMALMFALMLALLLNVKVKGSKMFRTFYYIPTLVNIVSVVFLWQQLLGPDGLLNWLLSRLGIAGPDWFRDYRFATLGLAIMGTWSVGGTVVIFLSSLIDVPRELYEAVEVDGGRSWAKFWNVTLPGISPIIFYTLLTQSIAAFQTFVQPMLMTAGAYNTNYLAYEVFTTGFTVGRQGYAAAQSWIMMVIIGLVVVLIQAARRRWAFYGE